MRDKNMGMQKLFIIMTFSLAAVLLFACYTPSPLYGAWADNAGNKITFADDGSFTATIVDSNGDKQNFSGSFSVIENVISFSMDEGSINTEWDIRGSMLYLVWSDMYGELLNLKLYKIS